MSLKPFRHSRVSAMPDRLKDIPGRLSHPDEKRGNSSRPDWFRKSKVPLTIVCGAPGSGKSTYVREKATDQDLQICFDAIATRLFGRQGSVRTQAGLTRDQVISVLRARNDMLADLMYARARERWSRAWMILSEPRAEDRLWWHLTVGATIVVLLPSADECRRRIEVDNQAGDRRGQGAVQFIDRWWAEYSKAYCDQTIAG